MLCFQKKSVCNGKGVLRLMISIYVSSPAVKVFHGIFTCSLFILMLVGEIITM